VVASFKCATCHLDFDNLEFDREVSKVWSKIASAKDETWVLRYPNNLMLTEVCINHLHPNIKHDLNGSFALLFFPSSCQVGASNDYLIVTRITDLMIPPSELALLRNKGFVFIQKEDKKASCCKFRGI